jgi:hypothetical protein
MVLYDVYNSPFIELQTPLTTWCGGGRAARGRRAMRGGSRPPL